MTDLKTFAASYTVFGELDKEVNKFYKIIEDKNIKLEQIKDVERVERFFLSTLDNLQGLIDKSQFPEQQKTAIKAASILDFHVRFAEKYGFNPMIMASMFGKKNEELVQKAIKNKPF